MYTIERQPFFFFVLLAFIQLGNAGPLTPASTVSELIVTTKSDKLVLVNYFKKLKLDKYCNSPPLKDESFKECETNNPVPCLCTVIYYMNEKLECLNVNLSSVESAMNKTNNNTFNDPTIYEIWKNVFKTIPSLKLLMEPLKNIIQLKKVCYISKNNEINSCCMFLNVEVLLHSSLLQPEESSKEIPDNLPEKTKKQEIPNGITEESKKSKDQPETNDIDIPNYEVGTEDAQKLNEENNNFATGDEIDQQTDLKVINIPIKTKINSQSSNDYPKEDDGTLHTETKETVMVYSKKNAFTNGGFRDTEDSHFFFYFGIMTVLSMMFYLALYNKKKIIALLIEGRRSTNHRRRPNTASYSKVETDDGSTVF